MSDLRGFDLTEAVKGSPLRWSLTGGTFRFLSGPDSTGIAAIVNTSDGRIYVANKADLQMRPLFMLEGRPVYRGDALYADFTSEKLIVSSIAGDVVYFKCGKSHKIEDSAPRGSSGLSWSPIADKKPAKVKVELEGWRGLNDGMVRLAEKGDVLSVTGWERVPSFDCVVERNA